MAWTWRIGGSAWCHAQRHRRVGKHGLCCQQVGPEACLCPVMLVLSRASYLTFLKSSVFIEVDFIHFMFFFFLINYMCVCLVAQLCLTLCNPLDCCPSGSFVHGILQTRILEWVAMPSSRGSSQPRDQTQVSCIADGFLTVWVTREAQLYIDKNCRNITEVLCILSSISPQWLYLTWF